MKDDRIEPTIKPIDIDDSLFDDDVDSKKEKSKSSSKSEEVTDSFDLDFSEKTAEADKKDVTDIKLKFEDDDDEPAPMVADTRKESYDRKPASAVVLNQPSVLSPFGRLDRLRASIFVAAATTISFLLIVGLDPMLSWLFGVMGVETTQKDGYQIDPIIYMALGLSFFILSVLLVAIKRLRDANFSPFLSILLFLPLIQLITIYLCVLPGTGDNNRYGPSPRAWGIGTYLSGAVFLIGVPLAIVLFVNMETVWAFLWDLVPSKEASS